MNAMMFFSSEEQTGLKPVETLASGISDPEEKTTGFCVIAITCKLLPIKAPSHL